MGQKREFSTFFASNSIALFAFIASYAAFASFAGAFLRKKNGKKGKKGNEGNQSILELVINKLTAYFLINYVLST